MFKLGVEVFLDYKDLQQKLSKKRIAVLAHPASTNKALEHTLDLLKQKTSLNITAAFGPQHGMRGEKQDNMIESDDYLDPQYKIPVYSLYGKVRRPTAKMMGDFDVLLIDLQDVGCRIYTFLTTLFYFMDACSEYKKTIYVLDRPNPAGRPIEGLTLDMAFESFVGAAPLPMRHGMTLGEAGQWYKSLKNLAVDYNVIPMEDYDINKQPWPAELPWINPSPNLPRLSGTQAYPGSVLIEGTHLSEGRGTTTPLELIGAPKLNINEIIKQMQSLAPHWMSSCIVRPCFFEPTFHKYAGELCSGIQIHTDISNYKMNQFMPYRLVVLFLKALTKVHPDYKIWKEPPYEYEEIKKPFDILSGSSFLREWINRENSSIDELESRLQNDEQAWTNESKEFLIY